MVIPCPRFDEKRCCLFLVAARATLIVASRRIGDAVHRLHFRACLRQKTARCSHRCGRARRKHQRNESYDDVSH